MVAHGHIDIVSPISTLPIYVGTQPHHDARIPSPSIHTMHGNGHLLPRLTQHNHTGIPQHIPHTTTHTRRGLNHLSSPQRHLLTTHQLRHLLGSPPSICDVGHHRHTDQNKAPRRNHHCEPPSPTNCTHPTEPHNRSILGRAYLGLFQNPLTQAMNPTITMPTVHPTGGLTSRRTAKPSRVVFLLQDPETMLTYEEYGRDSF